MERLSESERDVLWDLYEAGESQRSISRRLGRSPSTVRTQLVSAGWRRPTPPPEWCSLRLSLSEREEISRGLARDESLRSIASRFWFGVT
jgi:IS30 family transposase